MEHKTVQDVHIHVVRIKRRQTKTRKVENNMDKNRVTLDKHCLVRFNRKSGKIDTTLEAVGNAQLKMWALMNCTKTKDIIIFHKETGNCVMYLQGTGDFPKVFEEELGNIESYCPGLLEAMNVED